MPTAKIELRSITAARCAYLRHERCVRARRTGPDCVGAGRGVPHLRYHLCDARKAEIKVETANRAAARLTIVGPVGVLN